MGQLTSLSCIRFDRFGSRTRQRVFLQKVRPAGMTPIGDCLDWILVLIIDLEAACLPSCALRRKQLKVWHEECQSWEVHVD